MTRPTLSVLMPAYNEAPTIEQCIALIEAVDVDLEIVVVDDGSTDGTRAILNRLAGERDGERFRVVEHAENQGKGMALRTGIPLCRGEITIIQDADLEYSPSDYPALIAPILAGQTEVVYGSRRLRRENDYGFDRYLAGSLLLTHTANLLYGCGITDEPTCYKVFRTELLQSIPLRCTGFEFCPEVTAEVARRGHHIVEVPIRYHKRTVEEGKKIAWQDAAIGLWTLVRCRLGRAR